jgi:hypothetical protein
VPALCARLTEQLGNTSRLGMPPSPLEDSVPLFGYRWIAEKFGILLAPMVGYFLYFFYEIGYCGSFGVPLLFIKMDLTAALIFTGALIAISPLIILLIAAGVEYLKPDESEHRVVRALRLYLPMGALVISAMAIYNVHWHRWIWYVVVLSILIAGDFIIALFGPRDTPYLARLEGPFGILTGRGTIWHVAKAKIGTELTVLIASICLGTILVNALGESVAFHQERFTVPSCSPDSVVVRMYGDKILCARFEPSTKKVLKEIFVLTVGADSNISFETKLLGPLKFERD